MPQISWWRRRELDSTAALTALRLLISKAAQQSRDAGYELFWYVSSTRDSRPSFSGRQISCDKPPRQNSLSIQSEALRPMITVKGIRTHLETLWEICKSGFIFHSLNGCTRGFVGRINTNQELDVILSFWHFLCEPKQVNNIAHIPYLCTTLPCNSTPAWFA